MTGVGDYNIVQNNGMYFLILFCYYWHAYVTWCYPCRWCHTVVYPERRNASLRNSFVLYDFILLLTFCSGARAAQVVPHVHFHIIPRPDTKPEIKSKSWTMFGRGQRDDLDDEDGASIAAEMRQALREEVAKLKSASKL